MATKTVVASSSLETTNADIINCLTKLGIYLERDRAELEKMTPTHQNTRIQAAFDRAVETCCIFPLIFSKKELSSPKKISLGSRMKWKDRKTNRLAAAYANRSPGDSSIKLFVQAIGTHSLWGPFRMGRYSVEDSAKIQGASVRLESDVPELETLIMRWLALVTLISTTGQACPGICWSLTHIPATHNGDNAHLPIPLVSTARLAVQPLDVVEIQLDQDIDSIETEVSLSATREKEFAQEGYVGNLNRRAVPVIVLRYATSVAGLGSMEAVQSLINHAKIRPSDAANAYLTNVQLSLFSRLLESNARRFTPADVKKYQADVPKHIREKTSISFLSPLYCPSPKVADEIEIGRRARMACEVCHKEQSADVKLFFCSACSGSAYCSPEHQTTNWSAHKLHCRSSKLTKSPATYRIDPKNPQSALTKALLPLQKTHLTLPTEEGSYCVWNNPVDRVKPASRSSARSQCARTIYGPGQRFLVRVRWGGHGERMYGLGRQQRLAMTTSSAMPIQARFHMTILHIADRPFSFSILLQKATSLMSSNGIMRPGVHDEDNTEVFEVLVNLVKRYDMEKAECVYLWATRKGDCIEVLLEDIPDQRLGW